MRSFFNEKMPIIGPKLIWEEGNGGGGVILAAFSYLLDLKHIQLMAVKFAF